MWSKHQEVIYEQRNKNNGYPLVHNHPEGITEPSEQDQEITGKLVEAGKLPGIEVIDHIIVTKDEYFSFSENRRI